MVRLRIDELLEARGQTAYWLAGETGLPHSAIYKLRHGKLNSIRFNVIELLCKALGCGPGELLEIVAEKPVSKRKAKSKSS